METHDIDTVLTEQETGTDTFETISPKMFKVVRAAWAIFALLCLGLFAAGLSPTYEIFSHPSPDRVQATLDLGISVAFRAQWILAVEITLALVSALIGILIFLRKQKQWMTVFSSLLLITFGTTVLNSLNSLVVVYPGLEWWVRFANALNWALLLPLFYLFPDSILYPKWTRWATGLWLAWTLVWFIFPQITYSPMNTQFLKQPTGFLIFFGWLGTGVYAQIKRFRQASSATQKQQTKWVVYGFAIAVGGTFIEELPPVLFPELLEANPAAILYQLIATTVFLLSVLAVPITLAVSIRRNRLWEIDFVINRSLVYAAATGLLALIYAGTIILLQKIFETFTGGQQSTIAVAASTLVIAALFQPVRKRMQVFIDKRFYDIQIDYHKKGGKSAAGFTLGDEDISLGAYQGLSPIGRGGMSEIYVGHHKKTGERVAIKILPPQLADKPDFRKRFEREIDTIAELDHPNIVKLKDHGYDNGINFMVMEYIPNENLANHIMANSPLELDYVIDIVNKVAAGLDHAHQKGVIHRDVKPSNVLLQMKPDVLEATHFPVLSDFGIAKFAEGQTQLTQTGMVGTFGYIAPEQIQGSDSVDLRADIYALGVMVFQMLTGKLPFPTHNPGATLIAHLQQPPPDPRLLRDGLNHRTAETVLQALEKNPDNRFKSAGEFAKALAASRSSRLTI